MKRYSEYKDSGVKWLGEIPNHWEVKRVGKICNFSKGLQITKADLVYDGVPVVSYGQVHAKYNTRTHLSSDMIRYVPESYRNNTSKVQIGEFIVADTSEDIEGCGNMAYNDCENDLYAGYHTIIIKNVKYDYPKYLAYFFNSLSWRSQIRSLVNGVKVYTINRTILKGTFSLLPTKQEQEAIVDYLDAVTTKIDNAIAQQQKMIELLNERKQIIINNAVTKGLNPNVQMKDSGVEWIGEIPEHWEIKRGKFLFQIINELSTIGNEELLSVSDKTGVTPRKMKNITMFMSESLIGYKKCRIGDICSNIMWMWHGAVGVTKYEGVISPSYGVYRQIKKTFIDEYLDLLLRLPRLVYLYTILSTGLTESRLRLYPSDFLNINFFVPPINEQLEILDFIDLNCTPLNKEITRLNKQIALLQERKQIIINDVVTGKVKVI